MKIAIVGLGVVGLSVSARLAQAGYDVSGFERFPRGLSQGSSRGDTRIFRLAPGEGSVYVDLAANALRGWQALEKHVGKQIIDWTSGYMAGPSGSDFVQSCVLLAKTHRCEYTVVDAKEVERFTSEWITFPSGWDICHLTDCGVIRADEAISALVRSALDHGAQLHWGWQVEAPIQGSSLKIGGTWDRFDRVIVSSGPWLPSLLPEFANFVNVTRKVVAWFAPKDAGASPPNLPLICVDDANGAYGMPTPRGLYKIGLDAYDDNRVLPDDVPPPQADDIAVIARTAQRYLPKHGVVPVHDDACIYTMTADWNFLIAETGSSHVLCLSCCSGHGFKHAPGVAEIAVDWVQGRENAFLSAFAPGIGRIKPALQIGCRRNR